MSFGQEMIDVACPDCGEVYHLRGDSVGKRVQCHNKLCKHYFLVEAPAPDEPPVELPAVAPDSPTAPPGLEILRARTIEPEAERPSDSEIVLARTIVPPAEPLPSVESPPPVAESPRPIEEAFAAPPVQWPSADVPPPAPAAEVQNKAQPPAEETAAPSSANAPAKPAPAAPPTTSASPASKTASARKLPPAPPAKSYLQKRKRPRWQLYAEIGGVAAVVLLAIVVGVQQWRQAVEAPERRWKELQEDYQEHKWSRAKKSLEQYAQDFPDSPHTANVPFFADMCDAGEGIFSQTGDAAKGLSGLQSIFRKHRDSPAYRDYAADLYQAASRLVDRFVERAEQTSRLPGLARARAAEADLARARQAHELLSTVAESMKDSWVPETTKKLAGKIAAAADEARRRLRRLEILALFEQIQKADASVDVDDLNHRLDSLLASEPALAKDGEIVDQRTAARRAEATRVRFVAQAAEADRGKPSAASRLKQQTAAVVWRPREAAAAGGKAAGEVIISLARGVLYVFDERGKLLWFRRLGIDSYQPPLRLAATAASPEALVAVSSEDGTLVALEAAAGHALWTYPAGGDISAPLTIVEQPAGKNEAPKRRGLLPTADGELHVLELNLGKRLGRIKLGRPVTVGGAYDPLTGLAYFAADSERIFAIDPAAIDDPQRPACRSLLRTHHPSGSIRSAPLVVGQYLVLSESIDWEQTKLMAFDLGAGGFADPEAKPLAELAVRGWSWFPPQATAERIVLATDQGAMGLFGFNLDNRREAIYRLIEEPGDQPPPLPPGGGSRALAVHADDYLLWVMSDGALRKLAFDWFSQSLRTLWPNDSTPSPVTGVPIHAAQAAVSDDRLSLFLTTMSPDGRRFHATAVEGEGGARLWRRQLGLEAAGNPISTDAGVLMVDASGRTMEILASSLDAGGAANIALEPEAGESLPAEFEGQELLRLIDVGGKVFLAAASHDGRSIAVRPLHSGEAWRRMPLVARLQGRPAVMGEFLVVPCADGRLYRLRLDGQPNATANEQPFRWSHESDPGPETAEVYALADDAVLVCDAARRLRRLQFRSQDQISQWVMAGEAFESPQPLTGACLAAGDRIFAADASGAVHALDVRDPSRQWRSWSLGGRVTGGFVFDRDRLFAVVDERRVACLDLDPKDEAQAPRWMTKPFAGRISGSPTVSGDVLLVADGSPRVSGLRRDDGQPLWQFELGPRVGPAAAPAPLGKDKLLVPLADGTLLIAPIPNHAQELAEAPR